MLRNHAAWSLGIEHTHLAPQRLFSPSTNARGAYTTTGVKSSDNRGASYAGVAHLHPLPSPIFPPRGRVLWAVAGRQTFRGSECLTRTGKKASGVVKHASKASKLVSLRGSADSLRGRLCAPRTGRDHEKNQEIRRHFGGRSTPLLGTVRAVSSRSPADTASNVTSTRRAGFGGNDSADASPRICNLG